MTARGIVVAAYVALALSAVALEVAGRARRLGLVPLGEMLGSVRASPVGRLVMALGWAWLGWHLLAR